VDDELERGRAACARRVWEEAHESLARADAISPLGADDVELLSLAAYMLGRDDESMGLLERAHQAHLEAGSTRRAVRAAEEAEITDYDAAIDQTGDGEQEILQGTHRVGLPPDRRRVRL